MESGIISRLVGAIAILGLLAACKTISDLNPFETAKNILPQCPTVKLLKDADKIINYKPGVGRDLSDISFEAELTGFSGECEYIGNDGIYTGVALTLKLGFDITRGPAEKARKVKLAYFVAVPEFFPNPRGKSAFSRVVVFPRARNSISLVDDPIEIEIPLKQNRYGPEMKIFVGFQLTKDQLELNRQRNSAGHIGE